MALPSTVNSRIIQRFEELVVEGGSLIEHMKRATRELRAGTRIIIAGPVHVSPTEFFQYRTKVLSIVELLSSGGRHIGKMVEEIRALENYTSSAETLLGYVQGLKSDYESGMLESLARMIEANIAADYLGQAEQLLHEGQPGRYDHVPAAVLTGAILEGALRSICDAQQPPIDTIKQNGDPKTMNLLIDDLRKANVFNKIKGDQLHSWAKVRNAAAHGEFTEFTRQDVEQMLLGVKNFLADYS